MPIWITEIGVPSQGDGLMQAEYLKRVFNVLSKIKEVPVVNWYGWSDRLLAGPDEDDGFGLVNKNNIIKPSGIEFGLFNVN